MIDIFYDGACAMCRRQIARMSKLDRAGRLRMHDITAPTFRASDWGRDPDELLREVHARLEDGTWVGGVEVFRSVLADAGFGPLVGLSRLPGVAPILDRVYRRVARTRSRDAGATCRNQ